MGWLITCVCCVLFGWDYYLVCILICCGFITVFVLWVLCWFVLLCCFLVACLVFVCLIVVCVVYHFFDCTIICVIGGFDSG